MYKLSPSDLTFLWDGCKHCFYLKVIVKRTLCQYGYPPDMQKLATETVLRQAELIAAEWTGEL